MKVFYSRLLFLRYFILFLAGLFPCAVIADGISEWGGSNYVVTDLKLDRLNTEADWKDKEIFKTPACLLQANRDKTYKDLSSLRASGQRKVALLLWHTRLEKHMDCKGFLLDSSGGVFSPGVVDNLVSFLQLAAKLGFDEVQIRFAPMGKNWPKEWKSWNESLFQENWSLIRSTAVSLKVNNTPRVVFDLGAELGGLTAPGCVQCPEYTRRMWQEYTTEFGADNSYGFSIAYAPGRLGRLIDTLRAVGPLPTDYAVDLYVEPSRVGVAISNLTREANDKGLDAPEFLIQETYYADQEMYQALLAALRQNNVTIRAVMQWPQVRGSNRKHFGVSSTPDYLYHPTP